MRLQGLGFIQDDRGWWAVVPDYSHPLNGVIDRRFNSAQELTLYLNAWKGRN